LFDEEFEQALGHLEAAPESGRPLRRRRGQRIRRWLLPKSRYHVYYSYDPRTDVLEILRIWSAARGHNPAL
jgi:plasmid stabilization system protein ParE